MRTWGLIFLPSGRHQSLQGQTFPNAEAVDGCRWGRSLEQENERLRVTPGAAGGRDEFEKAYAERSGVTVESLHLWGRYAEPCECGDAICEGWIMGFPWENALAEDATR